MGNTGPRRFSRASFVVLVLHKTETKKWTPYHVLLRPAADEELALLVEIPQVPAPEEATGSKGLNSSESIS